MFKPSWSPRLLKSLERIRDSAVVVAVSGGGDSVGLLRAIVAIGAEFGLRISVAHFNHGVRGDEAKADARFVADLASNLKLPFDLGEWSPTRTGHFEADARRARYGWLAEIARNRGATAVAVGQTLDDQAETILHRIVRGTGVGGLGGMAKSRELVPGVMLVRPLLDVTRSEVRDYLAAIGQEFREDSTNGDTSRTRSRIRLDLLPKLADEYNPKVAEALVRLGRLASKAGGSMSRRIRDIGEEAIYESTAERVELDRRALIRLDPVERAELIRLAWRESGWPEGSMDGRGWRRLASLATGEDRRISIGLGVEAIVTADRLTLVKMSIQTAQAPCSVEIPGRVAWGGFDLVTTLDPDEPRDESVDLDWISPPLFVRQPEAGDRFEPLGLGGQTQALNDFFRGRKVARENRTSVPIVCDQAGIIWVAGHRIAHRVRMTEGTCRTLGLRLDPPMSGLGFPD